MGPSWLYSYHFLIFSHQILSSKLRLGLLTLSAGVSLDISELSPRKRLGMYRHECQYV